MKTVILGCVDRSPAFLGNDHKTTIISEDDDYFYCLTQWQKPDETPGRE